MKIISQGFYVMYINRHIDVDNSPILFYSVFSI